MRRSARWIAGLALLAVLSAPPAGATIRRDLVKLRFVGPAPTLEVGEPATLKLELAAARDAEVARLEVVSRSLTTPYPPSALPVRARAGTSIPIEVEVLPTESPEPLVIRYEVDGELVERSLDLSPLLRSERERRSELVKVNDESVNPRGQTPADLEQMRAPAPNHETTPPRRALSPQAPADSRAIQVQGRFVYYRSDGAMIGVDGIWVRMMEHETNYPDEELASSYTDSQGYFNLVGLWDPIIENQPDIYVLFETEGPQVTVQSAGAEIEYSWATAVSWNFPGINIQYGTLAPADQESHGALHIHTDIRRDYRWYSNYDGISIPKVDVQWPESVDRYYYDDYWEEIHLGGSHYTWSEATHARVYAQHFLNRFATYEEPIQGGCVEECDGHVCWACSCEISEGVPDWLAHVQTSSYAADYGLAALVTRDMESQEWCGDPPDPGEQRRRFGSLLQDIWDAAQDVDPHSLKESDALALGTDEILAVIKLDKPTMAYQFMEDFRARFPQARLGLWQTGCNNRLNMDQADPGTVTGLASSSHALGVASPKSMIRLDWNPVSDDWSGVVGHELLIDRPAPQPDTTILLGEFNGALTYPLPPGTYAFGVRAFDREGRFGPWTDSGPYVVVQPTPADLVFTQPAGWARPIVVRPAADATVNSVPNPTFLAGNAANTYFNYAFANTGQQMGGISPAASRLLVDGAAIAIPFQVFPSPGEVSRVVNVGPHTVRGGRHHAGAVLDIFFEWDESNEANNAWGHPWIWSPLVLNSAGRVRRTAPPGIIDGWWYVTDGSPLYYSCDGLRFPATGFWNCFWIAADDNGADYDCRIHTAATNVNSGFDANVGASLRGPGCLDLVVTNLNTVSDLNWDVGVTRNVAAQGTYVARHVQSEFFTFNDSVTVAWADSEYVRLFMVYVAPANAGPVTAVATGDPTAGPFYLAFLDQAFTTGGLSDGSITSYASDANGRARVNTAASAGYHAVLLYRDPKDGRSARSVVFEVERTPPDVAFVPGSNWAAPFVPRPAADGTPSSVPPPDSLIGNAAATYLNSFVQNLGPVSTPSNLSAQVLLDGALLSSQTMPAIAPLATWVTNSGTGLAVRGGRHTLAMRLDAGLGLEELEEVNNPWGEQYVWSPLPLLQGVPISRSAPPERTRGWSDVQTEEQRFYNCDGLRTPLLSNGAATWAGVAVMPGSLSEVDLQLHEIATGAKAGFAENLSVSSWPPGESNYVLMNFGATTRRKLDVGVVNGNDGVESYTIEASSSAPDSLPPDGTLGPYGLGAGRIFALREVALPAGGYTARLVQTSGPSLDWGLSVHAPLPAIQAKSEAVALSWLAGVGEDEEIVFGADSAGTYCFAAWKVDGGDLPLSAQYEIEITSTAVDAPASEPPMATRLASPAPSPFLDATTIAFDLSKSAVVGIEIYDVSGSRVRTLSQEEWPAGRHRVTWDGGDDAGRRVAPGVYFVRMTASGSSWTNKVVKME